MKDLSNPFSNVTVELLLAILRCEDNMILAFPFYMGHTLPILHNVLLFKALCGAFLRGTLYFLLAGSAKPFQVSRPKAVVYLRLN
jgi:hypothetical protein